MRFVQRGVNFDLGRVYFTAVTASVTLNHKKSGRQK